MFDDLLINPITKKQLINFYGSPTHGLLLSGASGSGKLLIAERLAAAILKLGGSKPENSHQLLIIKPKDGTIAIERSRQIKKFLQLKTSGQAAIRRVVIVDKAEVMTIEAQNALLKILEEPPADTLIILTSDNPALLRPTITSRTAKVTIRPVALSLAQVFLTPKYKSSEIDKSYLLSEGQAGLLISLLEQGNNHPLHKNIAAAKKIITAEPFKRLILVNDLAANKAELPGLLEAFYKLLNAVFLKSAQQNRSKDYLRLNQALNTTLFVQQVLAKNANAKLLLTHLLTNV